ncbi:MAG: polysaccharide deacetylase family protein [Nitrososphaeraceae archaeon]
MTSNQKLNLIRVNVCVLIILIGFLLFLGIQQFDFPDELHAQLPSESGTNDKVVILNFDDNRISQFTQVKPILEKYGFKATFYVVCKYLDNKKGYMNWTELETLYKEGTLLKDYDNLKKLVDDIGNGDLIDDNISLNDFKGTGAYQDADKNIQDCINLAAKIGHNLRDVEIVHCFDDANYFKDKYLNVSASQNKVPQRESEPEQNVTQANATQKVPELETELKRNVLETNASLTTPQTNASQEISKGKKY